MKSVMSAKQIEEINELLANHGDALTAFYDEGLSIGKSSGFVDGCMAGFSIGACFMGGVVLFAYYMTNISKKKKQQNKEES